MNIKQISLNIDQKVAQIDKQLEDLKQKLADGGANNQTTNDQLLKDVAALERIKTKLQKSRSIMWEAHELQRGTDENSLRKKRWLGIGLCVVSGLGLILLLIAVLTTK